MTTDTSLWPQLQHNSYTKQKKNELMSTNIIQWSNIREVKESEHSLDPLFVLLQSGGPDQNLKPDQSLLVTARYTTGPGSGTNQTLLVQVPVQTARCWSRHRYRPHAAAFIFIIQMFNICILNTHTHTHWGLYGSGVTMSGADRCFSAFFSVWKSS